MNICINYFFDSQILVVFVKISIALQFFFQVCGIFAYLPPNFAADI